MDYTLFVWIMIKRAYVTGVHRRRSQGRKRYFPVHLRGKSWCIPRAPPHGLSIPIPSNPRLSSLSLHLSCCIHLVAARIEYSNLLYFSYLHLNGIISMYNKKFLNLGMLLDLFHYFRWNVSHITIYHYQTDAVNSLIFCL